MVAGRIDALPFVIRHQEKPQEKDKGEMVLDLGEEIALVFTYVDDMVRRKVSTLLPRFKILKVISVAKLWYPIWLAPVNEEQVAILDGLSLASSSFQIKKVIDAAEVEFGLHTDVASDYIERLDAIIDTIIGDSETEVINGFFSVEEHSAFNDLLPFAFNSDGTPGHLLNSMLSGRDVFKTIYSIRTLVNRSKKLSLDFDRLQGIINRETEFHRKNIENNYAEFDKYYEEEIKAIEKRIEQRQKEIKLKLEDEVEALNQEKIEKQREAVASLVPLFQGISNYLNKAVEKSREEVVSATTSQNPPLDILRELGDIRKGILSISVEVTERLTSNVVESLNEQANKIVEIDEYTKKKIKEMQTELETKVAAEKEQIPQLEKEKQAKIKELDNLQLKLEKVTKENLEKLKGYTPYGEELQQEVTKNLIEIQSAHLQEKRVKKVYLPFYVFKLVGSTGTKTLFLPPLKIFKSESESSDKQFAPSTKKIFTHYPILSQILNAKLTTMSEELTEYNTSNANFNVMVDDGLLENNLLKNRQVSRVIPDGLARLATKGYLSQEKIVSIGERLTGYFHPAEEET